MGTGFAGRFAVSEPTPITNPEWMDSAACASVDPELWFPERGSNPRRAKRICADCPVRAQCLAFAVEHHIDYGIWGGLTEHERRPYLRARERQYADLKPCGTAAAYRRHMRRGEPACGPCLEAERLKSRESAERARERAS